jgi:hypothetical protein
VGVDVTTGAGPDEALTGVDRIVDVTNAGTTEEKPATSFFTAVSERLQQAGARAGVQGVIVLSIVGIDRLQHGYWAAKLQHEVAQSGPVPTSILRSTQFHEFAAQVLAWGGNGDVSYVPEMRVQPIASASVSEVLVDMPLANGGLPAMSEVAGPRVEQLLDMAVQVAARHHEPPRVEGDAIRAPTAPQAGALLAGPQTRLLGPTFQEWFDAGERVGTPRQGTSASPGASGEAPAARLSRRDGVARLVGR